MNCPSPQNTKERAGGIQKLINIFYNTNRAQVSGLTCIKKDNQKKFTLKKQPKKQLQLKRFKITKLFKLKKRKSKIVYGAISKL